MDKVVDNLIGLPFLLSAVVQHVESYDGAFPPPVYIPLIDCRIPWTRVVNLLGVCYTQVQSKKRVREPGHIRRSIFILRVQCWILIGVLAACCGVNFDYGRAARSLPTAHGRFPIGFRSPYDVKHCSRICGKSR